MPGREADWRPVVCGCPDDLMSGIGERHAARRRRHAAFVSQEGAPAPARAGLATSRRANRPAGPPAATEEDEKASRSMLDDDRMVVVGPRLAIRDQRALYPRRGRRCTREQRGQHRQSSHHASSRFGHERNPSAHALELLPKAALLAYPPTARADILRRRSARSRAQITPGCRAQPCTRRRPPAREIRPSAYMRTAFATRRSARPRTFDSVPLASEAESPGGSRASSRPVMPAARWLPAAREWSLRPADPAPAPSRGDHTGSAAARALQASAGTLA